MIDEQFIVPYEKFDNKWEKEEQDCLSEIVSFYHINSNALKTKFILHKSIFSLTLGVSIHSNTLIHKIKVLLMGTNIQYFHENNFKKDTKRFL